MRGWRSDIVGADGDMTYFTGRAKINTVRGIARLNRLSIESRIPQAQPWRRAQGSIGRPVRPNIDSDLPPELTLEDA